jgi:His-Xaa-Ser system protein HxsD
MADEIVVEFDAAIQSLDAINAAAYRLIGTASCRVEKSDTKFLCHLTPNRSSSDGQARDFDSIRSRYIDLVTDENVRAQLALNTEPVRNLILSLAFGTLASQTEK